MVMRLYLISHSAFVDFIHLIQYRYIHHISQMGGPLVGSGAQIVSIL
uniref:Uncharacterized protein n=1 Tax=Lepeophtheirus salmonis TaxID=72036 RepID=A0A0K2T4X9_LEPSM